VDEPRHCTPRTITDSKIAKVVTMTLEQMPSDRIHCSTRATANASGLAPSTAQAFSLEPHRSETFKLPTDPLFVETERALAPRVDEKSQIRALDRTLPILPLRPGQAERRTYDFTRHGTTSLFGALDVNARTINGRCLPRHRASEFRRFLDTVEKHTPVDLDIHVVTDNASSHNTQMIRNWFAKRPNWHVHFTPTLASWLNQVDRFFALLTEQQIKRGAHSSTTELEAAITTYIGMRSTNSGRSAGPSQPTTFWLLSTASAAAPSPSKHNVHSSLGIRTLGGIARPWRRARWSPAC
jgi:hypothetical protein